MLNPRKLPEKTHSGMMEDAVGKIPAYSSEWTNFNPSDPGITILENLAAFQLLQHGQMDTVTDGVKEGLLRLMGYEAQKGKCARVLLEASGVREPVLMPADQRFLVGDISFETALAGRLTDNRIAAVYTRDSNGLHDHSYVLDQDIPVSARIFTENPADGMELYLVLEKAPEPGEEFLIHVRVGNRYKRNPFQEEGGRPFASLSWACYTKDGFVEMKAEDKTHAFLEDGEIRFTMPEQEAARYEEGQPVMRRGRCRDTCGGRPLRSRNTTFPRRSSTFPASFLKPGRRKPWPSPTPSRSPRRCCSPAP